ncbi:MAG: STAS domain-containing protein [Thermoanaerobaculia bacterium]
MPSLLEIEFDSDAKPATAMLYLRGEAGYRESAGLRDALFAAIDGLGDKNLVVDLEGLSRLDTAAMSVLVEALVATRDQGPDLFLVCASESVRRVFHLAGLDDALTRCFGCWAELEKAVAV